MKKWIFLFFVISTSLVFVAQSRRAKIAEIEVSVGCSPSEGKCLLKLADEARRNPDTKFFWVVISGSGISTTGLLTVGYYDRSKKVIRRGDPWISAQSVSSVTAHSVHFQKILRVDDSLLFGFAQTHSNDATFESFAAKNGCQILNGNYAR